MGFIVARRPGVLTLNSIISLLYDSRKIHYNSLGRIFILCKLCPENADLKGQNNKIMQVNSPFKPNQYTLSIATHTFKHAAFKLYNIY